MNLIFKNVLYPSILHDDNASDYVFSVSFHQQFYRYVAPIVIILFDFLADSISISIMYFIVFEHTHIVHQCRINIKNNIEYYCTRCLSSVRV